MRLINFIVALSGVAIVASELQTLSNRNVAAGEAYEAQGVSSTNHLVPRVNTQGKETTTNPQKRCKPAKARRSKGRRLTLRALKPSQLSAKTDGTWLLYEEEWVTAVKVKMHDKVAATDVSGCTVAFFWNRDNVPSAYHFFCGNEVKDATKAVADLAEMGSKVEPVHVTIAADGDEKYKEIVDVIRKEFQHLDKVGGFTPLIYHKERLGADERYRYDAVAGSRSVRESKIPQSECSRQNPGKI
ncbi:MAG: hypothetical protein M1821_000702 [Bathelium mastoideum]|nr:MAG: hypothetical protein M1821_000702 [Bathelium mastoideum]